MFYKRQNERIKTCYADFSVLNPDNFFLLLGEAIGSYDFRDPKEKLRLEVYYNLLEKYQYPIERIEFDMNTSSLFSESFSDIVVFKDDERKIPLIAIDCLRDKISKQEFALGVQNAIIKAKAIGAEFAVCVSGNKKRVIKLLRVSGAISQKIIRDLPIAYEIEE